MKKILMIVFILSAITQLAAEVLSSNSVSYEIESLSGELTLTTTEYKEIILSDKNTEGNLIVFSESTLGELTFIVESYSEMDTVAEKANYKTSIPPSMRSKDNKYLQFKMVHDSSDDSTIITINVEMEQNGVYAPSVGLKFTMDNLRVLLTTLQQGFDEMEIIRTEVLALRKLEDAIRTR